MIETPWRFGIDWNLVITARLRMLSKQQLVMRRTGDRSLREWTSVNVTRVAFRKLQPGNCGVSLGARYHYGVGTDIGEKLNLPQ